MTANLSSIPAGPRGHGKQRRVALPAGDREDQEPLLPQPDAGHEHREEAGPEQQERGEQTPCACARYRRVREGKPGGLKVLRQLGEVNAEPGASSKRLK